MLFKEEGKQRNKFYNSIMDFLFLISSFKLNPFLPESSGRWKYFLSRKQKGGKDSIR
jgi:hypothetical protein